MVIGALVGLHATNQILRSTTNNKRYSKRKRKIQKKKNQSVPPGYKENWKYVGRWSETKLRRGLWKFRFQATKRRKAKTYGSFGRGTTGSWKIKGIQHIKKTNKGEYQTDFRGTKVPLKFNVKKPRRNT